MKLAIFGLAILLTWGATRVAAQATGEYYKWEGYGGYLHGEKIPAHIIRLREPTRVNVIVTTGTGRQMRFNAPGPKLARAEWGKLVNTVEPNLRALARPARKIGLASRTLIPFVLLVLSGSLPRGVPVTAYAQLIRLAHGFGIRTLLDCDGPAFVHPPHGNAG